MTSLTLWVPVLTGLLLCLSSSQARTEIQRSWTDYLKAGKKAILLHKYEIAEQILRAGEERAQKARDANGINSCLDELAEVQRLQHRYTDAEQTLQILIKEGTKSWWPDHPYVIHARHQLVKDFWQEQDHKSGCAKALPFIEQNITDDELSYGEVDTHTADDLYDLARCDLELSKPREAQIAAERALSIREKILHANDDRIFASLGVLASACEAQKDDSRAEQLYLRMIQMLSRQEKPEELANTCCKLATIYAQQGKLEAAESVGNQAISAVTKADGKDSQVVADKLIWLGDIYLNCRQGRAGHALAESKYRRAIEIYKQVFGPNDETTKRAMRRLQRILKTQEKDS